MCRSCAALNPALILACASLGLLSLSTLKAATAQDLLVESSPNSPVLRYDMAGTPLPASGQTGTCLSATSSRAA